MTYKWVWQGKGSPPLYAVVEMTSSATFNGIVGHCDDGISEQQDTPPGGGVSETTYQLISSPGDTITQSVKPSASGMPGITNGLGTEGTASVTVNMSVTPLAIHFTDSNGTGTDTARQYIIGQNVTAQLSTSLSVTNESWSASGGSPFLSYAASQSSAVWTALPSSIPGSTFSGYFATPNTTPTITCTFTIAGQNFSVPQTITMIAPSFAAFKAGSGTQGGYLLPNPTGLYTFGDIYDDPLLGNCQDVGVDFGADLTSSGQFQYVQTVNMARTRSSPSQTLEMPWPVGAPTSYLTSGLDTIYPSFPTPAESSLSLPLSASARPTGTPTPAA